MAGDDFCWLQSFNGVQCQIPGVQNGRRLNFFHLKMGERISILTLSRQKPYEDHLPRVRTSCMNSVSGDNRPHRGQPGERVIIRITLYQP